MLLHSLEESQLKYLAKKLFFITTDSKDSHIDNFNNTVTKNLYVSCCYWYWRCRIPCPLRRACYAIKVKTERSSWLTIKSDQGPHQIPLRVIIEHLHIYGH